MLTINPKTPFDDLAIKVHKLTRPEKPQAKYSHVLLFLQVCRVNYIRMWRQREDLQQKFTITYKTLSETNSLKSVKTKDLIDFEADLIANQLAYFGFIEELNRFGTFFNSKYLTTIPDYFVIKFYRNKIIEHWEEYYEEYLKNGQGVVSYQRKLMVPEHLGHNFSSKTLDELITCFQTLNREFNYSHEDRDPRTYTEEVFKLLKSLDPTLQSRKKIPDTLVNALLKYEFPTPINSIEEYSVKLIKWVEDFIEE